MNEEISKEYIKYYNKRHPIINNYTYEKDIGVMGIATFDIFNTIKNIEETNTLIQKEIQHLNLISHISDLIDKYVPKIQITICKDIVIIYPLAYILSGYYKPKHEKLLEQFIRRAIHAYGWDDVLKKLMDSKKIKLIGGEQYMLGNYQLNK